MNYISLEKKKIVGRNNQTIPRLVTDFDTNTSISFNFIDASNKIVDVPASAGLYFAGSMTMNPTSGQMLWLCNDFTIDGKTLTFNNVDTYTSGYFNNVTKKGTDVNIEIGVFNGHQKEVLLRDFGMANPRIYLNGLDPHDIDITDFYTKSEVDALIASIEIPIVGNGILTLTQNGETLGEFNANDEYNVTIDIPGGGGDVTSAYVEEKIDEHDDSETAHNARFAEKQDVISNDSKLAYSLISGTPSIPTKTSDLTNDSSYQTASDVSAAVSGKANSSDLTAHTTNNGIHVTTTDKQTWNAKLDASALNGYATETYVSSSLSTKQDTITSEKKLSYSLISGTPTIPTKTSDLVNDSTFQTASEVAAAVSGKADKTYVTTIAAASSNVQLQDGAYVHTPTAAVTYALPAVTDTLFHTIILTVSCAHTTSITFTYNGATVTPLDSLMLSIGDKAEYLCRWESISSTWIIACGRL